MTRKAIIEDDTQPTRHIDAICAGCGAAVTQIDFCYGCGQFVCPTCTGAIEFMPLGKAHTLTAHKAAVEAAAREEVVR